MSQVWLFGAQMGALNDSMVQICFNKPELLRVLDDEIVEAAAQEVDAETKAVLHTEADGELAPFAQRMPGAALERARAAAFTRLVRDAIGLPVLTYE